MRCGLPLSESPASVLDLGDPGGDHGGVGAGVEGGAVGGECLVAGGEPRADRFRAGLWERLHHRLLNQLGVIEEIDWSRAVVDSIAVRAERDR